MSSVIDSWESQFGGNEEYVKANKAGFDYDLDVAYRVRVADAKVTKTKRGDIQVCLDLQVREGGAHGEDGDIIGSTKEWLTLPKQATDKELAKDLVKKITLRRRDDFQRILMTQDAKYAIYSSKEERDGKKVYLDPSGNVLTGAVYKERELEVNTAVMALCDSLHEMEGQSVPELIGAEFYLVKSPNKKKPEYPYTNIFSSPPENMPVFGTDSDGVNSSVPF